MLNKMLSLFKSISKIIEAIDCRCHSNCVCDIEITPEEYEEIVREALKLIEMAEKEIFKYAVILQQTDL